MVWQLCRVVFTEPIGDSRAVDVAFAHQLNGGALQLGFGLQVVATICPKQRFVQSNYCGARFAEETCDPGHLGPVGSHIFAGMRVIAWYDAGGHAMLLHQRAERQ